MVSNFGAVKSLEKMWVTNKALRKKPETIMKQAKDGSGYYRVWFSKNGLKEHVGVHRLVAMNFLENPLNKSDVNHINGIKTDNRLENLEWTTRSENVSHAYKNDLIDVAKGSRHGMSILKEDDVLKIRELSSLYTKNQLAEMFRVGRRTINGIVNRESWKHI